MKIKLVGALPPELKDRGLKPGDEFNAVPSQVSSMGAMQFWIVFNGEREICTVWPYNFKRIY